MSGHSWAPLAWIGLLILSWPYVQRVRYAGMAPFAAYLIFAATVSAMAAVLFGMITAVLASLGQAEVLDHPTGIILFLVLGFSPGLVMGSWLIQRPLRRVPLPGE